MNTYLNKKDRDLITLIKSLDSNEILKNKDSAGKSYLSHVFYLHKKLFGGVCSYCPQKIKTYIQRIKNFEMKKTKNTTEQKYKMKSGKVIHIRGTHEVYSEHNLTDDVAIQLLAENPNRKVLFAKLPENWETEIQEVKNPEPENAKPEKSKAKEVKK